MSVGSVGKETYSHRKLSGSVLVSKIVLTGWGATGTRLLDITDGGRLWGTTDGVTIELHKAINDDGSFSAAEEVASSAVIDSEGNATLTEENGSGLSGTINVAGVGTFDIIIAHCDELDIIDFAPGGQENFLGTIIEKERAKAGRFEEVIRETKREIDRWLIRDLNTTVGKFTDDDGRAVDDPFPIDARGRSELAVLASPEQLREVQIWLTLRFMARKLIGRFESASDMIDQFTKAAADTYASLRLLVDVEGDRIVEEARKPRGGVRPLTRN